MKFTRTAIWSAFGFVAATTLSTTSTVNAFAPVPTHTATQRHISAAFTPRSIATSKASQTMASSTSLNSYTVGIVGATGAVGKEIRNCLEDRGILKVDKLRFFGSARSAGKTVSTKNSGDVEIELFSVDAARECDVIFLAVDGDFALAHAKAISEGDDGAVVIDNSVSRFWIFLVVPGSQIIRIFEHFDVHFDARFLVYHFGQIPFHEGLFPLRFEDLNAVTNRSVNCQILDAQTTMLKRCCFPFHPDNQLQTLHTLFQNRMQLFFSLPSATNQIFPWSFPKSTENPPKNPS